MSSANVYGEGAARRSVVSIGSTRSENYFNIAKSLCILLTDDEAMRTHEAVTNFVADAKTEGEDVE